MDLKQQLITQAMRMMQDPRVAKALQNPRLMQGVMGAFTLRARVQTNLEAGARNVAKRLNLVTEAEVRELRHNVERLERELQAARGNGRSEMPPPQDPQERGHAV